MGWCCGHFHVGDGLQCVCRKLGECSPILSRTHEFGARNLRLPLTCCFPVRACACPRGHRSLRFHLSRSCVPCLEAFEVSPPARGSKNFDVIRASSSRLRRAEKKKSRSGGWAANHVEFSARSLCQMVAVSCRDCGLGQPLRVLKHPSGRKRLTAASVRHAKVVIASIFWPAYNST